MPDYSKYQYGRIATLAKALDNAGVAPETREAVMAGGEAVRPSSSNAAKADWMRGAMERMDSLMDLETRKSVRESCACSLGGKRAEICSEIVKRHSALEDRIAAANEAKYVFGQGVERLPDGSLQVRFFPEGQDSYQCVCLRGASEPISMTYCYCCGGHIRHHLQTALGRQLSLTAKTTALSSGGKESCTFVFRVED